LLADFTAEAAGLHSFKILPIRGGEGRGGRDASVVSCIFLSLFVVGKAGPIPGTPTQYEVHTILLVLKIQFTASSASASVRVARIRAVPVR